MAPASLAGDNQPYAVLPAKLAGCWCAGMAVSSGWCRRTARGCRWYNEGMTGYELHGR